ncbi:GDSL-type esterase/lipase family protein [Sphingobacterium rhinopitheci]|uniref:GDSL-type esterase/lipase family protein n=1 Tax=Sphingobacterium rhinopitheci TaxID=2781960 RepID=UPI001F515925|nr:GDSL-type esterase/lipase family protein [Sphingobacterium rhinopitheci]MCI0920401.1 GDSL family lipase [Sphingobacterium rhinopitheci]
MKLKIVKYSILTCLLSAVFYNNTYAQAPVDSNYIFSGYTEKVDFFNKMPTRKGPIIFIGDSLTDAGRWADIAPDLPILNRGISGDISFGVLARLDEIVKHQPQKVFLMIGVNDLKRNVPTSFIINNYKKIVSRIQMESPRTIIYLNSILPINSSKLIEPFRSVKNEDVAQLNRALKEISASNKNVHFVDLHKVVADKDGQLRADITSDGIHMEVAAYIEVIDYLKKVKAL